MLWAKGILTPLIPNLKELLREQSYSSSQELFFYLFLISDDGSQRKTAERIQTASIIYIALLPCDQLQHFTNQNIRLQ